MAFVCVGDVGLLCPGEKEDDRETKSEQDKGGLIDPVGEIHGLLNGDRDLQQKPAEGQIDSAE